MKYRITIEQEVAGHWKKIHEEITELIIHERAARLIEKVVKDAGLEIDPRDLRKILAEELGEVK